METQPDPPVSFNPVFSPGAGETPRLSPHDEDAWSEKCRLEDLSIHDDGLRMLTEHGVWIDDEVRREMEAEKKLYAGSSTWAAAEERLFEVLYLRQELPILPSFWEIDFRGIPISERCFGARHSAKPVIYSHRLEFRATMALTRLVDLTANVRSVIQCGLPDKATAMIKKSLDSYVSWAAQDGCYSHLDVVPNIIVEAVDGEKGEAGVTRIIENRMRALARLQREYYLRVRPEEPGRSWRAGGLRLMNAFFKLFEGKAAVTTTTTTTTPTNPTTADDGPKDTGEDDASVKDEQDRDVDMADIPPAPSDHEYRRRPPVVYGLFIVNTSIFIMSVDAARGDLGYVTFHVDLDLKDYQQSVWNALTMAMVVCIARDDMMSRLDDFEAVTTVDESDVDI